MGKADKLKHKLLNRQGFANWHSGDLGLLLDHLGFENAGGQGSHSVWKHPNLPTVLVNVQIVKGKAKPYQLKQILDIVRENNL